MHDLRRDLPERRELVLGNGGGADPGVAAEAPKGGRTVRSELDAEERGVLGDTLEAVRPAAQRVLFRRLLRR
ncbi:MAG TPA: hypothetical protein VEO00_02170, partial [Actinomycetota bacterium]|nr:hypothetical protein [Actinomycetota bacterium]